MPLIVPDVGKIRIVDWAFKDNDPLLYAHLYTNNYTPVPTSVLADFIEANYAGYAPIALANWDPAALDGFGRAYTSPDTVHFVRGAGPPANSIYGYFVTDLHFLTVQWAELFPGGPYAMITAGQQIDLTCYFTGKSEF